MLIRDAIHRDINIEDELIQKIIRTTEFQRLKRIKQLGLSYYVYPGAEHSRYVHSIGVYCLAKEFIYNLEEKTKMKFESKDKKSFLIACLLHDLGHGPFSHASENFFQYDHEQYTIKIINFEKGQIHNLLKESGYMEDVVKYIKKEHENKILNSLLSSTIDVDRMDYLARDSYYCGVSYGNFDLERLLKVIDVDIETEKVVFTEDAIHPIEDFLLSRYHMFIQVYLNDKAIGYETLVETILYRIIELAKEGYTFETEGVDELFDFYDEEISVENFLNMDDYKLFTIINKLGVVEKDEKLKELIKILVEFKELKIIDKKSDVDTNEVYWKSQKYEKAVYSAKSEIYIKKKDGSIVAIEEVSKFSNFLKKDMKIVVNEKYYQRKK